MKCINRVFLVGRLGAKPESKLTRNGKTYARFSVATNQPRTTADGTQEYATQWHKVTAWGQTAQICLDRLEKGSQVFIEGELSSYKYENNGQTHHRTCVNAQTVSFQSLPVLSSSAILPT